jgi:hypothetical protein
MCPVTSVSICYSKLYLLAYSPSWPNGLIIVIVYSPSWPNRQFIQHHYDVPSRPNRLVIISSSTLLAFTVLDH